MSKQRLSAAAAKAKAVRRAKKAHSQRERRAAIKAGRNVANKDYDHKRQTYVSVKSNRGNEGKGTKKEGSKNYKTT